MKPPRFHPAAEEEYGEAIEHYADADVDVAATFQTRVEAVVQRITERPKSFVKDEDTGSQECVVKKFPYSVHYLEMDDHIWIVAVAHHKRKPGYWHYRLRQH
jgi:toxin ParE1/3/4